MSPLDLIPAPYRIAAELALVAVLAGGVAWFVHHERAMGRDEGRAEVQAQWDHARAAQQDQALAEAEANAKETQRRLTRQKEAQDANDTQIAAARRDAEFARAAAGRLSGQLADFTAAARRAAGNPAAAGDSPPVSTPIDLLADLFSRSDATAGELAAALDASHAAGLQCERSYDSLTVKP